MANEKIPFLKRLNTKLIIFILSGVILLSAILSSALYYLSVTMVTKNTANNAFKIAEAAAKDIVIEEFKELNTVNDEVKESYIKMRQKLSYIREISGAKYVYTMRKTTDGNFMYVVDGSAEEDMSHIGDTEDSTTEYEKVWNGEVYVGDKIENQEEWGILISSYYPLKDGTNSVIGFVGVDYNAEGVHAGLQRFKVTATIVSLIAIITFLALGMIMINYITKPILQIADISNKVAGNNLNVDKLNIKSSDELGILTLSFNRMVNNLRNMALKIHETTNQLRSSSDTITGSIEELSASSEEISRNILEIASGVDSQAQESEKTYEITNNFSEKVEDITTKLSITLNKTNIMKDKNIAGSNAMNDLEIKFSKYIESVLAVASRIESLSEESKQIEHILQTINSIAKQTNLLALNAAIEAARAGESGRGFSVVADEVRKLAEQSTSSTKEIQEIIGNITKDISNILELTNESKVLVHDVSSSVKYSKDAFDDINVAVNDTIEQIKLINTDVKEVDQAKSEVLASIKNISNLIHQSASSAQEISSAAEEQSSGMEEIASSVQMLDEMVKSLSFLVSEYKL